MSVKSHRLALGTGVSLALHVVTVIALERPVAPPEKKVQSVVELSALPVQPPRVEPPPPPVDAPVDNQPAPRAKKALPRTNALKAALQPDPPATPPAPVAAPVVLAGVTLSNAGTALAVGGTPSGSPIATATGDVNVRAQLQQTETPELTPASDLSRKPVPPRLEAALARHYPVELRARGVEGEALIRVVLGKNGRVSATSAVSESHPGFGAACRRALAGSQWDPPIDKQGKPTNTAVKYRCRFQVTL